MNPSKKAFSAPIIKITENPENDEDQEINISKKSKIHKVKPKKTMSATNIKRPEIVEDDYLNDQKSQHSKEFLVALDRLNIISEGFDKAMEEENEINSSTEPRNIAVQISDHLTNIAAEDSSEDVRWEIIGVSGRPSNDFLSEANSQNVITMEDELNYNVVAADSIISHANDATSDSINQKSNDSVTVENFERSLIPPNEFNIFSPKSMTKESFEMSRTNNTTVIINGEHERMLSQQFSNDFHHIVDDNMGLEEIENDINASKIYLEDIETERFQAGQSMINDLEDMENDTNATDIFRDEMENKRLHTELSTMKDLENVENSTNQSEIYLEEIENKTSNAGPSVINDLEDMENDTNTSEIHQEEIEFESEHSTTKKNVPNKYSSELALRICVTNYLQGNTTQSNISEGGNNNNEFSIKNKELASRIKSNTSSFSVSNLKRCGHSNTKSDLLIVRNRKVRKYCVTNSNNRMKNNKNVKFQRKYLQTFVMNTLKDTHPGLCFKDDIAMRLEIFLWDMLHRIGDEAENLVTLSNKKVFDKRVLKYAVKLSLEKMKNEADVMSGKRHQWLF